MPRKDIVTQIAEMKENRDPIWEKRAIGTSNTTMRTVGIFSTKLNRIFEFH